jgi:membrane dipeptidase
VEHIGIGSDFDGIGSVPIGLEDVSTYPALTAELISREYGDEEILNILGRNVLRVMRQVEDEARRIQLERGPSEALIEDLDGTGD